MPLIQWSSALSVSVKEIDDQHVKLIQMINNLDTAMQSGQGKTKVGEILAEMLNYTKSHFAMEERYFEKFGYPDAPAHKAEHQKFIVEVAKFKQDFESGALGLSIKVLSFLSDWLRGHIMGVDKKYSAFFNEKGLK
jgi:hemerythrin